MSRKVSQLWDIDLIRKHDLSGPRYTSYPTAPQFKTGFNEPDWAMAAKNSNLSQAPLSLYFHIPFCDTVCYYCACNKIITANHKLAEPYLQALLKEIQLQADHIDQSRSVDQLHWGGGTPTYLTDEQMGTLMSAIADNFMLRTDDSGEYAIEIHPKGVTPQRLAHIRKLGFNRLSMGVQDFDPDVQKAVNRFNSFEEVAALMLTAKQLKFKSTSIDLIYGLPLQSVESFTQSLKKVIDIHPDRISIFNYAHMPELFKTQKRIDASQLPEPQEKLQILHNSIEQLLNAGYIYVGMDHFALPEDELAKAQLEKKLHRNFQGYSTHGNCELFSFGVSAIATFGSTYIQNHKTIDTYYSALEENKLPIHKGIELSLDDKIRQTVISELICHFELSFIEIEQRYNLSFKEYFADELKTLIPLANDGLIDVYDDRLLVKDTGRLLIRRVCMTFDAYLQAKLKTENSGPKYSRII
ncbi:oxygen-independent coproporphyrinogen III oxidase [Teredinibacter haidensis]|uniref:oxygen-independent coproporphyrinogen III oxidase n=1 Tax=Teredinibacter haidensis TaxID=2731755 RepID=UPI000948C5DE|nr:oxygen-independent coproporphyrinogen III oxidase [Teredinibacter haidensis]